MSSAARYKRLAILERQAPRAPDPGIAEVDRWCEAALGCTFDDLDADDLRRIEMLLLEAPEFAHPLLLRACIARAEDREPPQPKTPRPAVIDADPEWSAWMAWTRRRWGYVPARDDPEAWPLGQQLEAWATSPDRAYLRGADLRLTLHHAGVLPWDGLNLFELRRLVSLCTALDALAIEHPSLEAPSAVFWAALGWQEHHPRRRHPSGTRSAQQCA
jgi:hypothetical protein